MTRLCWLILALLVVFVTVPTPHQYTFRSVICPAASRCTQDLVQKVYFQIRNGIPGNKANGEIVDGRVYKVYLGSVWMGDVESRAASPTLTNHTTWRHVFFRGSVVRTFSADQGAWYSTTYGSGLNFYGGAGSALINAFVGPTLVFGPMDESITAQLRDSTSAK